jgi:hypothetical protein
VPDDLFVGLFDDAAIFPPGNADLGEAVAAHFVWRRSVHARAVGAFVCSSGRWNELLEHLPRDGVLPVSITVPGGHTELPSVVRLVTREARTELFSLEVPADATNLPELAATVRESVPAGVRTYVELPWAEIDPWACETLALADLRLKVRTGGTMASAFPDEVSLGRAIQASVCAGLPFKLTAGLHNAVRHRDPISGFEHHGFVNVLCATAHTLAGGSLPDIVALLAEQRADRLLGELRSLDSVAARRVRSSFVAFGTCSIDEPLNDLHQLKAIPEVSR